MLFSSPPAPTPAPAAAGTAPVWIKERLAYFADPRFTFDPEPHEYRLGERVLTSCTSWVKQYKEPFYAAEIAPKVAARTGQTTEEVLAEWERAAEIGTKTHKFIEDYYNAHLLGSPMPELYCGDGEVSLRCLKFLEIAGSRLQCFEPVGQEIRMFHEASGLCGTLDFLAYHKERKEYWVVDWKSNKVIRTDSDRCYGNMLGEFSDLKDNEHNVYSLQISLYRLFLKSIGVTIAGGIIVHLPTNTTPPAIYKTIDYTQRISTLTGI